MEASAQFPRHQRASFGGGGGSMEVTRQPSQQHSDNDRSSGELRALDCNLTSLCDHIQSEGFSNGSFSDVVVNAMGSTYHLHRLILSRSSYFRNMLHGPWREANAPVLSLHVDDNNVNGEAIAITLAYLYGHHPKLNDNNAFRVLAAASFLDLQDLCAICTDFIISELWTSNFLGYQVFAEGQDYGIHGERVRNACWGYLCQSGALELREALLFYPHICSSTRAMNIYYCPAVTVNAKKKVLPKLSSQTLHALLTSDELWVPSEEKRFELALYTLLAKGSPCKTEHPEEGSSSSEIGPRKVLESELERLRIQDGAGGKNTISNSLDELADAVSDCRNEILEPKKQLQQAAAGTQSTLEARFQCNSEQTSSSNDFIYTTEVKSNCSYLDIPSSMRANVLSNDVAAMEGPSEESSCYQLNNNNWLTGDQRPCNSINSSCDGLTSNECDRLISNEWGRCGMPPLSWGGRIVGRRDVKICAKGICGLSGEEYDTFVNIFEGGSLLYSNMTFEALLDVRKKLEELGFPGKAVNDSLWLQMLLSQRVLEIGVDTCKNCCLVSMMCACRQPFGFSRGNLSSGYYMQEHDQNISQSNIGNVYVTNSAQGEGSGLFRPVRVHVRGGPIDGLAGIGRGTTYVPAAAWPPTRFVFSRVPFGVGNRNGQQTLGNDDPDDRADHSGDVAGDGLTALVGLSQGGSNLSGVHAQQTERGYEADSQGRLIGYSVSAATTSGISVQMIDSPEQAVGVDWENANSSISLDMGTPLSHFPPFRFSVEFKDVHMLGDGQVKHSLEVFYAGSLWKVSVQAFNDEDPQGRRTLGLFLHRRKAEIVDPVRKVHMFVDSREKVTARYQLICPSKREVMVFGSLKQSGTLLPKAPKGWGWRTALLCDELSDLLQNGALRIAAIVQLI